MVQYFTTNEDAQRNRELIEDVLRELAARDPGGVEYQVLMFDDGVGFMHVVAFDGTTISAIAAELGVSSHTVSSIAMRATAELVAAAGPDRLAGVRVIGVDEHRWAPRRVGPEGFVHALVNAL